VLTLPLACLAQQADPTPAAPTQTALVGASAACRQVAVQLQRQRHLTRRLEDALADPTGWTRPPADLLAAFPTLDPLAKQLREARNRTARLSATRTPAHPAVQAARAEEEALSAQLRSVAENILQERAEAEAALHRQLVTLTKQLRAPPRQEPAQRATPSPDPPRPEQSRPAQTGPEQTGQSADPRSADPPGTAKPLDADRDRGVEPPGAAAAERLPVRDGSSRHAVPAASRGRAQFSRIVAIVSGLVGVSVAGMSYLLLTGFRLGPPAVMPMADHRASAADTCPANPFTAATGTAAPQPAAGSAAASDEQPATSANRGSASHRPGRMTLRDALARCHERRPGSSPPPRSS
jgi:hypothetical protein